MPTELVTIMKYFLPDVVFNNGWKRLLRRFISLCCLWLVWGQVAQAQVTGTVYRDFNANGVRETPGEIGIGGVTVTLYNVSGGVVGTAVSSTVAATQGTYSIALASTGLYRVQFSTLPSGYYEAPRSTTVTGGMTGVQFLNATTTAATINYGINYPADYCQANPNFIVPCYVNGDPTSTTIGMQLAVVALPYSTTGTGSTETNVTPQGQVGTVYGVAYQRVSKATFTSAFVKRHSGLGPGGAGAIYITKPGTGTVSTTFVTLPIAASAAIGTNAARGLPSNSSTTNQDPTSYSLVGKSGLGDLDISEDGTELYTVNLSDRKLYKIPIVNPTSVNPTAGTPVSYTLPAPASQTALAGSIFRPFAVKYYRGKVYVGGVNTNEAVSPTSNTVNYGTGSTATPNLVTRDTTGIRAIVYEFDPGTGTFSTSAVLAFSLTFRKGADNNDKAGADRADYWLPWSDVLPGTTSVPTRFARVPGGGDQSASYPQPWLTGIEFDVDGSMILSIRDRLGDQLGNNNLGPVTGDANLYRAIAPGDIMRAGKCTPGLNKWTIEYNAAVCSGTATAGKNNGQGVGGGEYYYADAIYGTFTSGTVVAPNHTEMSQGGLALFPGSGEVASIVIDPEQAYDAGGIRRFNNLTGYGDIYSSVEIFASTNVATYGKANGLGDLDIACDVAPIEIGNRLWLDTDRDGIQGASETATTSLTGLTVTLYQGATQVGSTTVASDGTYYFTNSNVNLNGATGVLPNTAYQIRLGLGQAALSGFTPTTADAGSDNDIDSDASVSGTNAIINLTTGSYGQNDHSYDIGLVSCPTFSNPSVASQTICAGSSISSLTLTTNSTGTNSVQFVYFTTQQTGTAMYTGGTLSSSFTPSSGTLSTGNTTIVPTANAGTTPLVYYAYAILDQTQFSTTCRPFIEYKITVNPVPTATAGGGGTVTCTTPTVALTGSSNLSGSTYQWSGPGAFASSLQNPTVSVAGTYSLTVSAGGCSSTNSATVLVTANQTPPTVTVTPSSATLTCTNRSATLTASGGGTYLWSSNGGSVTTAAISVTAAGTYSVTVTAANGCTATASSVITVNQTPPTASVTPGSAILTCTNPAATLTASGGGTYLWGANANNATTPAISVTAAGTYSVTVTAANGCTATASSVITVNQTPPTASVTPSSAILTCTNPAATLTASGGGTYLWGANANNATTPAISVTAAGTYSVTVTAANGCTATASSVITVNQTPPTAAVTPSSAILTCTNPAATLTASGGGTYLWGANANNATTPAISVTAAGTYSVTVTAANGCTATASSVITVNQTPPTASVTPGSAILTCTNPAATLTASGGGTYLWGANAGSVTTAAISVTAAGTYSVTVTAANGCTATASSVITANQTPPTAAVTPSSAILTCTNPAATLTASGGGTYLWGANAGSVTTAAISVTAAGTYSVTVTAANGCTATASSVITANQTPPTAAVSLPAVPSSPVLIRQPHSPLRGEGPICGVPMRGVSLQPPSA